MYGGTKTEMERLIADAAKLDSSIQANDLSFGNIVKAINVVQTEMGITGTTALEAGRTISGSVGSMKSAWTNLVTGFADGSADIGGLIDNLVTTIVGDGTESNLGVIGNVLPAVERALGGIVQLIAGAAPKIIEIFPGLVEQIVPPLITAATDMVNAVIAVVPDLLNTVVDAIVKNAPMLIDSALVLVGELINGVLSQLPQIVKLGLDLIASLANGIAKSLPTLIPTIIDVILKIVDTLTSPEQLKNLLDAAFTLVVELAYGLMDAIPQLVNAINQIVMNIGEFLTNPENIAMILKAALQIIVALGTGVLNAVPVFLKNMVTFYGKIFDNFKNTNWGELGKNLVDGLLDGLKRAWASITGWFTNAWDNLFGGVGDFLGGIFGGGNSKISIDGSHRSGLDYVPYDGYIAELHKGERVLTASEASGYGGTSIGNININIDGAKYTDEQSLASAIALEIQNMTDRRAAVYA